MTIGAIVLAAGAGARMGAVKPLVEVAGRPMLVQVLAAAGAAGLPALVVTGAHADLVSAAVDAPCVLAADHRLGMGHSLAAGVAAAPADWSGLLVLLADMPLVQPATLERLAARLGAGAPAVVPVHGGRRGNPAGFRRCCFPDLVALSGDRGARSILDRLGAIEVPVDDPGILADFDRPEDLPA